MLFSFFIIKFSIPNLASFITPNTLPQNIPTATSIAKHNVISIIFIAFFTFGFNLYVFFLVLSLSLVPSRADSIILFSALDTYFLVTSLTACPEPFARPSNPLFSNIFANFLPRLLLLIELLRSFCAFL